MVRKEKNEKMKLKGLNSMAVKPPGGSRRKAAEIQCNQHFFRHPRQRGARACILAQ